MGNHGVFTLRINWGFALFYMCFAGFLKFFGYNKIKTRPKCVYLYSFRTFYMNITVAK